MWEKLISILERAIEEQNWNLVKESLQIVQDIESGYYDNDVLGLESEWDDDDEDTEW